jgi:hypothetical protein
VAVGFIFLHYRQSDNCGKSTCNIEKSIILSLASLIEEATLVIRASHAVLRVFNKPWNKINPIKTATVWSFVGEYSKSVLIETAASVICARHQIWTLGEIPQAKSVDAAPAA